MLNIHCNVSETALTTASAVIREGSKAVGGACAEKMTEAASQMIRTAVNDGCLQHGKCE